MPLLAERKKLTTLEAAEHLDTEMRMYQFAFGQQPSAPEFVFHTSELLTLGADHEFHRRPQEVPDESELPDSIKGLVGMERAQGILRQVMRESIQPLVGTRATKILLDRIGFHNFGKGETLGKVAEDLGVSISTVKRDQRKALTTLGFSTLPRIKLSQNPVS